MTFCQSKGGIPYFETSAKEAVNVEQAFEGRAAFSVLGIEFRVTNECELTIMQSSHVTPWHRRNLRSSTATSAIQSTFTSRMTEMDVLAKRSTSRFRFLQCRVVMMLMSYEFRYGFWAASSVSSRHLVGLDRCVYRFPILTANWRFGLFLFSLKGTSLIAELVRNTIILSPIHASLVVMFYDRVLTCFLALKHLGG